MPTMEDISIITFHGVNENSEQPQSRLKLFIYAVLEIAKIVQSRQLQTGHSIRLKKPFN